MKPPTVDQAEARDLIVEKGIHTFSNGTEWDCWAATNCHACRHWDIESVGDCAFEAASWLGMVSPALALLFGWTEHPQYPGSWVAPGSCRFFRERKDDDGDGPERRVAPVDPLQMVMLADPTEDAALLTAAIALPIPSHA